MQKDSRPRQGYRVVSFSGTGPKSAILCFLFLAGLLIAAKGCPWQKKNEKDNAVNSGSSEEPVWQMQTIDSLDSVGCFTSIALDNNNKIHISYRDNSYEALKYATDNSGTWFTTTIDSTGNVGGFSSLALDADNKVYIAYYEATNRDLKLATNLSGTWISSVIDSNGDVGAWSALALDKDNKVHIAYCDGGNGDLKYADNISGTWNTYTIDSDGFVGTDISMALDDNNQVHICYSDWSNSDLKYATNVTGTWDSSVIDPDGGLHTSITIGTNDKVHVSYYDETNKQLKYATNESGDWVSITIDATGDSGKYSSITHDADNKIYISYYDALNGALKYATNRSGSWIIKTVDSADNVGGFTDIVLDSNNRAHISYYDWTNNDLKYATNSAEVLSAVLPASIPLTPSSLAATTISDSQINLSWTDNSDNETGFKIESRISTTDYSLLATVGVDVSSYSDSGLSAGTTYYYRVKAYNSAGDSGYSPSANATTGGGANIIFVQQPTDTVAGAAIDPVVTVKVTDQFGNPVPGVDISMSVLGGTTLWGTSIRTTDADGIATFDNLSIRLAGTNYRLRATLLP